MRYYVDAGDICVAQVAVQLGQRGKDRGVHNRCAVRAYSALNKTIYALNVEQKARTLIESVIQRCPSCRAPRRYGSLLNDRPGVLNVGAPSRTECTGGQLGGSQHSGARLGGLHGWFYLSIC